MTHPAMDTDALRRVAEAHHVAGAAMYRLADAIKEMGDVTQPAVPELPAVPAAEKEAEPECWRNDRPPSEGDADDDGRVWVWDGDWPAVKIRWYHAVQLTQDHKQVAFWAPGRLPCVPAPSPSVAASQEAEPGEWRNDGSPTGEDEGISGCVWCFRDGQPTLTDAGEVRLLYRHLCEQWWAPGNRPAPVATPHYVVADRDIRNGVKPLESPTNGWTVEQLPTVQDTDIYGFVLVPAQGDTGAKQINWRYVHPGMPWARTNARLYPWDPTCLDRNGWIRSRLPTVEDANSTGLVLLPMGNGGVNSTIAYALIVPGQPWAPWGSNPGRFEK